MHTHDDQMIFEQYQQIDEITLPFTGGKQMSIGKRLKKFIPGRIGKRASNQINVETDVNHFISDLQDYADTTGSTVEQVLADTQKFNNWVQDTIKVNPQHIKDWNKFVSAAAAEGGKRFHNYKALSAALTAAIQQRNEELRVRNRGQYVQQSAPQTPAPAGGYSSATTTPVDQQPVEQPTTAQAPAAPAAPAAQAQQTTPQQTSAAQQQSSAIQSRRAINAAAASVGNIKSKKTRARLIDYALDKFGAVEPPKQSTKSTKKLPAASLTTTGNVKPAAAGVSKESVYINSNVVTEDIKFIDCSKF